jgi:hypothetical protein
MIMDKKQRFSLLFTMMSLVLVMLFFQNCSSGEGLYGGSSLTDGFITDPPVVFASKASTCITPSTLFKVGETVYICIQNAGVAPTYCHTLSGDTNCTRSVVSSANGWGYLPSGTWVRGVATSIGAANTFWAGYTYVAYVIHTDDATSFGQGSFSVSQ